MKIKILAGSLIFLLIFLLGCTTQMQEYTSPDVPSGFQLPPTDEFGNPVFDPNAVCPYECCPNGNTKYYPKYCGGGGKECINNVCVGGETEEPEEDESLVLADNEVHPGVFMEIIGAKYITQMIKEPEEIYGLVGQYVMDEKRDGYVYGYLEGKKMVIVELNVENKSLDEEYRRETHNYTGLRFYIRDSSGEEYLETGAPSQNHTPLIEYYSDVPPLNLGDKEEVYISFFVPSDFIFEKLVMKQTPLFFLDVNREVEFDLEFG